MGSWIGEGSAIVKPMLAPAVGYRTTIFNADAAQIALLSGDAPAPPLVVRGVIGGAVVDSPIPTCLDGGYVPADCPSDETALSSSTLSVPTISSGGMGSERRSYLTLPSTCPSSGAWTSPVTLHFGDGVVETLMTQQPCDVEPDPSLPALAAAVRAPGSRAAETARKLKVDVRVRGGGSVLGVMAELRRIGQGGKVKPRLLAETDGPESVRGKRTIRIPLRPPGLRPGRYVVKVLGRDARSATDRFRVRSRA